VTANEASVPEYAALFWSDVEGLMAGAWMGSVN